MEHVVNLGLGFVSCTDHGDPDGAPSCWGLDWREAFWKEIM